MKRFNGRTYNNFTEFTLRYPAINIIVLVLVTAIGAYTEKSVLAILLYPGFYLLVTFWYDAILWNFIARDA